MPVWCIEALRLRAFSHHRSIDRMTPNRHAKGRNGTKR
jgi:hypothetical protein